jgi:hypothetical protein
MRRAAAANAAVWVWAWAGLWLLWLLLAGSTDVTEVVAGALAATVAATAAVVVRAQRLVRFRPRARWLRGAWRLPIRMVTEFGLVTAALWRRVVLGREVRGSFRVAPVGARGEDGRSIAHRVLTTAAGSFAPNAYVVGFDLDAGTMLLHELVPRSDGVPEVG